MDICSFIANIVGSLAWPTFTLVIVLLLLKPLRELIPLMQKLKYKDLELEFGRRIEEVSAEVARELSPNALREYSAPEMGDLTKLAEISPRLLVLEAWLNVEHAAIETANRLGANLGASQSYQAIKFLESSGKTDRSLVALLREMRGLRNEATHVPDFALGKEAALRYAESASGLAWYFRNVKGV
jgi:hypothetical protein